MTSTYEGSIQKACQYLSNPHREFISGECQKLNHTEKITPLDLRLVNQINFTLARGIIARNEPGILF